MNGLIKKKVSKLIFLSMVVGSFSLQACAQKEEEPVVVVEAETEGISYNMVEVTRDTVELFKNVSCSYVQTKDEEISFDSGGKRVDKVYVRTGDEVKRGDLLVELNSEGLQEKIDALEYEIAVETKKLEYLDIEEQFAKDESYYNFVYGKPSGEITEQDVEKQDYNNEDLLDDYSYQREDYLDKIEFDTKELEKIKKELANSKIYSNMNGIVYRITRGLEGSIAKKGEVVMTIVDNANGLFEAQDPDLLKAVSEGDLLSMDIIYGDAAGNYTLTPYNRVSWTEEKQVFSIVDSPEKQGLEVGTMGTMSVVLESREDVLTLPNGTVFDADGENYVYVLNEENMREVRFVEIGLTGNNKVEIVSGLNEGDQVVKR